jgi:arsenite methyltransferase
MTIKAGEEIKKEVRRTYGKLAERFVETKAPASCCGPRAETCCCEPTEAAEAVEASGASRLYSEDELTDLPEGVTGASAGCGNPTAIASLQPGEVVLDLGSGGGIDCFLAAKKVGPTGKVIGLDMTPEMIKLARRNAKKVGATNVDFCYGEMEDMPLPDVSVDVIISNCVINLSPDKDAVFAEVFRVLRPGGRVSVSDIVTNGELPESIRSSVAAWAGCLAGALDEQVYVSKMRAAGLADVAVTGRVYVNPEGLLEAPGQLDRKIASITVTARKPER